MNILILNWRDPKNPKAGGAEKLNLEILKTFVDRGDNVIWYSKHSTGLKNEEIFRRIRIIRFGNTFIHYAAFPFFLLTRKFGQVDFIIDCVHGTGYIASLFAPRTRKVVLICEVAKNIWDEMYSFPINIIGKVWEKMMFRLYIGTQFWTISNSTKSDLLASGIPEKDIKILPMGFDGYKITSIPGKYSSPTALFVGRLARMKGIEDAIRAIAQVNNRSDIRWSLNIIGRGDEGYENSLNGLIKKLGVVGDVKMLGFVDEREKFIKMAKSWVLVVPSVREGWGMIVPEANSVGTQVVGYDVPGLSDSLDHFSSKNIKISPTVDSLTAALQGILRPFLVKDRPKSGWDSLNTFVKRELFK